LLIYSKRFTTIAVTDFS